MIRRVVPRLAMTFLLLAPVLSHAYDAASLVLASTGSLPLILTVPHDGGDRVGMVRVRSTGAVVWDAGTRALAERIAAILEARLGQRPYLVIAGFSRKYLDANRPQAQAMEAPEALPAYRAYHEQIAAYVAELRGRFPAGALLVDVHGQSGDRETTFRGTQSGATTRALLKRFGPAAIQGEKSLIGVLAAQGLRVFPPVGAESLGEDPRYAGGYTVQAYGSSRDSGIDAIQLEFGRSHRDDSRLPQSVAQALITFMTEYQLLPR